MNYADYPSTRAEAKKQGSKYYFTGLPCKHGHIDLRKTKGACLSCLKIEWEVGKTTRAAYFSSYNRSEAGQSAKKRYYERNKQQVICRANMLSAEKKREYKTRYKISHPENSKAFTNDRRRRHKNATPVWLTAEQRKQIRNIYKEAQLLAKETGQKYAVDHIVPLMGKEVCGLHVPWNLQILTFEENLRKSNKLIAHDPVSGYKSGKTGKPTVL